MTDENRLNLEMLLPWGLEIDDSCQDLT